MARLAVSFCVLPAGVGDGVVAAVSSADVGAADVGAAVPKDTNEYY